jgi:hypothetical protein
VTQTFIYFPLILGRFEAESPSSRPLASYDPGVERLTHADRACAIAAAAAHDLNDELTIIVNTTSFSLETLEPGHPARPLLLELQRSAQRCVWKTSGLLNYGVRRGPRPVSVTMERLILESQEPALR